MVEHGDARTPANGGLPVADLRRSVRASAERLPALRRELAGWARRTGMSADDVNAVALAAYEAMANVVAHAYRERPGILDLYAAHRPGLRQVHVVIADRGRWAPPGGGAEGGGCGLPMIHQLAGEVKITTGDGGTTVRMTWPV